MVSCKFDNLKVVLIYLLLLAAVKSEEAMLLSVVKFKGRRLLLHNEVASPDHSDAAARASDESLAARGLTDAPHAAAAAAARRSLSLKVPSNSFGTTAGGSAPGTGPKQAPFTPIPIPL